MQNWKYYNRAHELLAKAGICDADIERLENEFGYFTAPASAKHHLNVRGGLVRHSINVTERLLELTEKLGIEWPRAESPYLVGMLHDLVKTKSYEIKNGGYSPKPTMWGGCEVEGEEHKTVPTTWGGHGSASVIMATVEFGIRLLPAEAAAIRWHMGAFDILGDAKNFDRALKEFPEIIIATHTADMLAAKVDEREVDETVKEGGMA